MDYKGSSKLSLSPHLDAGLVLDCCVEKYKQPGFKNVFGNKNKKWLKLSLKDFTLSYREDKASTSSEKSYSLEAVQRVLIDLSKDSRYYVLVYLPEKVIKFKFLMFQDWIVFTEVFTKISRTDTGEPLFKASEKYLSMLIEYKEKAAISNGVPSSSQNTQKKPAGPHEVDLNMIPKKAKIDYGMKPPTEHLELDAFTPSDESDTEKQQTDKKQLKIKKPEPPRKSEENNTHHDKPIDTKVVKERVADRRNDSSEEQEEANGRNDIIKNRLNIG